ncbi:MAG: hypothetical protein LBN00_02000 [Oscillospiraceae bacterium]|jgi:hypothetical protein|nr:hypothetical protein [Oscillospiraceae bacterium]
MTKNIEVVDEHGISYGVTYPKRAKGLVKNGRARYENDEKIVLTKPPPNAVDARPPEHLIMEDIKMSDKTNNLETARPPEFTPNEVAANLVPPKDFKNITPPAPATEEKFDYALAQKYYEIFIGGLVPLGPDSDSDVEDTRPEQARLMFEKLFRLAPEETSPEETATEKSAWQTELRHNIYQFLSDFTVGHNVHAFNSHLQIELLLNPLNPLHYELSKALSDMVEGVPNDAPFGVKTERSFRITEIAKRVLSE